MSLCTFPFLSYQGACPSHELSMEVTVAEYPDSTLELLPHLITGERVCSPERQAPSEPKAHTCK